MAIATTTALALAAMAAAAGSAYNTHQTAKKADAVAAEGIRDQSERQRQVNAEVNKTIDEIGAGDAEGARKTAGKQYLDQVQRSLSQANAGLAQRGLSSEFDARAGGAAAANAQYGADTAGLLARMDAPTLQRQAEGNVMGNTGMDLSRIAGDVQGAQFVNDMKLKGVRRNPYIDLVSGLLSGAASSGMGAGGAGNTTTATLGSGMTYTAPATAAGNSWMNAYGAGGF